MTTAKLTVMLVLVLLVGIFAGSLGTRIYLKHEIQRSQTDRHDPEERIKRLVGRLTDELKMDTGQQAEVRKVIIATDARATGIKASYEPELKRIYEQSFQRISEKLNEDQKAKLQKRQQKFSARFNAMYFNSLRRAQAGLSDMEDIARRLGLDGTQRSQVSDILKDQREREDIIIEKYRKMDHPDLMAANHDMMEVRRSSIYTLSSVLTEEQLDRFKKNIAPY